MSVPDTKKKFGNHTIDRIHNEIVDLFAPFGDNQINDNGERTYLTVKSIDRINYLINDIEGTRAFKGNPTMKLSFYELLLKNITYIKNNISKVAGDSDESFDVEESINSLEINVKERRDTLQLKIDKRFKRTFGKKLKDLLNEREITSLTLANLLGTSEVTVSNYCTGVHSPKDFHTLLQISKLLSCDIQYLIDDEAILPEHLADYLYKDTGLTEASLYKLRDIRNGKKNIPISMILNILIDFVEDETETEYDVLSSMSNFFNLSPYSEEKYMVSQNLIDQYRKELDEVDNLESAKRKFDTFLMNLQGESVSIKSLEREDILQISDIQQKLFDLKKHLKDIDELDRYVINNPFEKSVETEFEDIDIIEVERLKNENTIAF